MTGHDANTYRTSGGASRSETSGQEANPRNNWLLTHTQFELNTEDLSVFVQIIMTIILSILQQSPCCIWHIHSSYCFLMLSSQRHKAGDSDTYHRNVMFVTMLPDEATWRWKMFLLRLGKKMGSSLHCNMFFSNSILIEKILKSIVSAVMKPHSCESIVGAAMVCLALDGGPTWPNRQQTVSVFFFVH